jgi:hypothetical protein
MSLRATVAGALLLASLPVLSIAEPAFDAATAFGARPSVESLSLSAVVGFLGCEPGNR